MKNLEKLMKATANRRRLAILQYLKRHPGAPVGDIAEAIRLSFKATSKHLRVLSAADIIEYEKQSLLVCYALARQQHVIVKQLLSLL
ncbi:MAG: hypothetical protein G01um101431_1038 [Parcubacteria group bacterium Gr01-1014_31]|nr:MAG: hypothetical protein G01um101431_1038 [Parcubacteria group bacterium Gr01-1014_31]